MLIFFPLFGLTSVVLAEVTDKMPTTAHIWSYAAPLALLAFLCSHFKPAVGVVAIISTFFLNPGFGVWEMNHYLQGAVASEMGTDYVRDAYIAIAIPPLFGLIGILTHFLFRRRAVATQ